MKNLLGMTIFALGACTSGTLKAAPQYPAEKMTVTIGPNLQDCMGVAPMRCMVVDGGLFYDQIEGFTHKTGVTSIIEMERKQYCDPNVFNSCPMDAGIYKYNLIKIISEK